MRVPIEWLKEYVDIEGIDEKELLDKLIMSGSNLEGSGRAGEGISGVVIGRITKIEKHPEADKLQVCTVDVGNETLQIITAATNVYEGCIVPVALVGAKLAGGLKIKKGKLRNMDSFGMFCSLAELGYDSKVIPVEFQDGILLLAEEYASALGKDALETLGLDTDTIEFEITPNRSDCLSIVGMARETAATFHRMLKSVFAPQGTPIETSNRVRIETEGCYRYIARYAKNVEIKSSPFYIQRRLMNAGVRPHNNIVDLTNYVMLEYGQPLHAFDAAKVEGAIVVRNAHPGEKVVTLDGVERILEPSDIVVADEKKAIAIAGVMGLANSEISADTKDVIIEIASFDKSAVRATSKRLGLRSEASSRFEKGISVLSPSVAAQRMCEMMEEIGVGTCSAEMDDIKGRKFDDFAKSVTVSYDAARIGQLIGVEVNVEKELARLGIVADKGVAHIPYYRLDLKEQHDIVEEVARMYGYDLLPSTQYRHHQKGGLPAELQLNLDVADELISLGIDEILTYSFVSPSKILEGTNPITLLNPLGEDYSVMRTSLLPSMLEVLKRNINRKNTELAFFEIGRVYSADLNEEGLPSEKDMLLVALNRKGEDFFTAKAVVEGLMRGLEVKQWNLERNTDTAYLHPGRAASILVDGVEIGAVGEIHPTMALSEKERLYLIEIDLQKLVGHVKHELIYKPISLFPAAERDVAFVVDEATTSGEIVEIIRKASGSILESVELFDIYRGERLGEGKKSMAYSLKYRTDRTLSDEEVTKAFDKMVRSVSEKVGAQIRDN